MTIIKINAITVPGDNGDELAGRFAARAGAVDDLDGGAPGRGSAGEFPGPVTAGGRAPLRHPTPRRDEDR